MRTGDLPTEFGAVLPEIRTMGTMLFDPIWAEQDHPAAHFELLHVVRGALCLTIGRNRFAAGAGDTLLVPPNRVHRDTFDPRQGLEIFYCSIDWPAAARYCTRVGNAALLNMPAPNKNEICMLFDQLRHDLTGPQQTARLVARARLHTILMLLLHAALLDVSGRSVQPVDASYGPEHRRELLRRARQYIAAHYAECLTLERIAAALNVSPYYLSHLFSAQSDFTLFSYLTELRMTRARALLRDGRCNVSEAGRAVGYDNANSFSKAFKKHVGCAPRQYIARQLRRHSASGDVE